eukprot:CAMPEP_0174696776 /NCGR_PEP_ID=MMETSP1094-20130205/2839_1 /TAXON_ID=156173 /ORGANISM="Chrysochromulina brevifilum, Strain UTEX LB 985" /LENGTH=120 /DNA_ID=CAMNT_0015893627 /DNA_START=1238 /DNA_END=1601 /DNA_ORIENTATION=+
MRVQHENERHQPVDERVEGALEHAVDDCAHVPSEEGTHLGPLGHLGDHTGDHTVDPRAQPGVEGTAGLGKPPASALQIGEEDVVPSGVRHCIAPLAERLDVGAEGVGIWEQQDMCIMDAY